jgi:hypothetical protein
MNEDFSARQEPGANAGANAGHNPGDSTDDHRKDHQGAAGPEGEDELFRSHFQRVNRLADRDYDQVRDAYYLGFSAAGDPCQDGRCFADVETDVRNGWLNVRTVHGDWASVREFAEAGFNARMQGRVGEMPPAGTTDELPPYADPLARDDQPGWKES